MINQDLAPGDRALAALSPPRRSKPASARCTPCRCAAGRSHRCRQLVPTRARGPSAGLISSSVRRWPTWPPSPSCSTGRARGPGRSTSSSARPQQPHSHRTSQGDGGPKTGARHGTGVSRPCGRMLATTTCVWSTWLKRLSAAAWPRVSWTDCLSRHRHHRLLRFN